MARQSRDVLEMIKRLLQDSYGNGEVAEKQEILHGYRAVTLISKQDVWGDL